jgi:hypothetical protein
MKPTLLIMAAGMGSRYGGLKQIDSLGPNGEVMLDYAVYDALQAGFGKIVFIIRRDIADAFQEKVVSRYEGKVPVELVYQETDMLPEGFAVPEGRVKPWGTAHAVWCAREAIQEPFAVINADDFYGRDAFRVMADFLSQVPEDQAYAYAMVGYRIGNTLSAHGGVSRGICRQTDEGLLIEAEEHYKIRREGEKIVFEQPEGKTGELSEDALCSMNFWGFQPSLFEHLGQTFPDFLQARGTEMKSEFVIPNQINGLIESETATVKVLKSEARWFGVTYQADRPEVVARLAEMADQGIYPSPLW